MKIDYLKNLEYFKKTYEYLIYTVILTLLILIIFGDEGFNLLHSNHKFYLFVFLIVISNIALFLAGTYYLVYGIKYGIVDEKIEVNCSDGIKVEEEAKQQGYMDAFLGFILLFLWVLSFGILFYLFL